VVARGCERVLIEDNDFLSARAAHGILSILCEKVIVRNNWITNPWDRSSSCEWFKKATFDYYGREMVFDSNIIFDSDWDRVESVEGDDGVPWEPGSEGADGLAKMNCDQGIFRNNLICGNEPGKDLPQAAVLQLTTYGSREGSGLVNIHKNTYIYHNTFTENPYHNGIFISAKNTIPEAVDDDNINVKNNIFGPDRGQSLRFYSSGSEPVHYVSGGWNFSYNYCKSNASDDGTTRSLASMESRYGSAVFSNNIQGTEPTFEGPGTVASHKAAETRLTYAEMELAAGSVGEGAADPLTTVASSSTGNVVTMTDSRWFHWGYDVTEGDSVTITNAGGDRVLIITAINRSTHQVTMNNTAVVTAGDDIYLTTHYRSGSPNMGIADPTWLPVAW